jgi:hypothetical protein
MKKKIIHKMISKVIENVTHKLIKYLKATILLPIFLFFPVILDKTPQMNAAFENYSYRSATMGSNLEAL